MLEALHTTMSTGKPIYGMNRGSVGFLTNEYRPDGLMERLAAAKTETIHPLLATVTTADGETHSARAINEVSLLRQSYQAAKLQDHRRRPGPARRTDLRRRAARHARRLDRLQSLRPRADPADQRAAPGADADQRLPSAPLARRASPEPRQGRLHGARSRRSGRSTPSPIMSSSRASSR